MRLRSDIWVSAYLRRCSAHNIFAALRKRGAAEAGAIFVKVDLLNGTSLVFGPAPQSELGDDGIDRRWQKVHKDDVMANIDAEDRLRREMSFDPDLWIVEIESASGEHNLDGV
ncbi:MAG: DUF1491 family protein [Beijerinckiaceae bacterium]|jgi:hypothetical protein|nr:DUF1491 family protein [Beijerinckiaceae bacterium]